MFFNVTHCMTECPPPVPWYPVFIDIGRVQLGHVEKVRKRPYCPTFCHRGIIGSWGVWFWDTDTKCKSANSPLKNQNSKNSKNSPVVISPVPNPTNPHELRAKWDRQLSPVWGCTATCTIIFFVLLFRT